MGLITQLGVLAFLLAAGLKSFHHANYHANSLALNIYLGLSLGVLFILSLAVLIKLFLQLKRFFLRRPACGPWVRNRQFYQIQGQLKKQLPALKGKVEDLRPQSSFSGEEAEDASAHQPQFQCANSSFKPWYYSPDCLEFLPMAVVVTNKVGRVLAHNSLAEEFFLNQTDTSEGIDALVGCDISDYIKLSHSYTFNGCCITQISLTHNDGGEPQPHVWLMQTILEEASLDRFENLSCREAGGPSREKEVNFKAAVSASCGGVGSPNSSYGASEEQPAAVLFFFPNQDTLGSRRFEDDLLPGDSFKPQGAALRVKHGGAATEEEAFLSSFKGAAYLNLSKQSVAPPASLEQFLQKLVLALPFGAVLTYGETLEVVVANSKASKLIKLWHNPEAESEALNSEAGASQPNGGLPEIEVARGCSKTELASEDSITLKPSSTLSSEVEYSFSGLSLKEILALKDEDVRKVLDAKAEEVVFNKPDFSGLGCTCLPCDEPYASYQLITLTDLREQIRSQRMQAIGQLARGVAHDFNNLLTIISCSAAQAKEDYSATNKAWLDLNLIEQNSLRAGALVQKLLTFSKGSNLKFETFDVSNEISALKVSLGPVLAQNTTWHFLRLSGKLPITMNKGEFSQVVLNLIVNASDAMPKGGKINVSSEYVSLEEALHTKFCTIPRGKYAKLTFKDQGTGITEENQTKIFKQGFTTKGDKGNGLGLSTIANIVQKSGGYIDLKSTLGVGSEFILYFPLAEVKYELTPRRASPQDVHLLVGPRVSKEAVMPLSTQVGEGAPVATLKSEEHLHIEGATVVSAQGREEPQPDLTGSATILLVDDEPGIRSLASRALQGKGYQVIAAPDGQEALEILQNSANHIELIISDLMMPGLNGKELIDKAREMCADLRAILMSGYADDILNSSYDLDNIKVLSKPFTLKDLVTKVKQVLTG